MIGAWSWDLAVALGLVAGSALLGSWLAPLVAWPYPDPTLRRGLESGTRVSILVLGVIVALAELGLELGPALLLVASLIIAATWVLHRPLSDLASGVILRSREPYRPGERVRCGAYEGRVLEQGSLAVILEDDDGVLIHLPNAAVLAGPIENHSRRGRVRITFGLSLRASTDPTALLERLQELLEGDDDLLDEPAPLAVVSGLGLHSVEIELRGWVEPDRADELRARLAAAVATIVAGLAPASTHLRGEAQ